jgi:hypothetical protein
LLSWNDFSEGSDNGEFIIENDLRKQVLGDIYTHYTEQKNDKED